MGEPGSNMAACNLCALGIVGAIAARPTRILALGMLLVALACCGLTASPAAAKPTGPRATQVTLGYNRARGFFYGIAQMPRKADGSGGFACLEGNRHFPDGARLLRIYRCQPGPDRAISPDIAARAATENGRIEW